MRRQPDMHVKTLKSMHFLKPQLNEVVLQKTESDFMPQVLRTKPISVEQLFEQEVLVLLQVHKFFGAVEKSC